MRRLHCLIACLLLLIVATGPARACTGTGVTSIMNLPANLEIPRDLPVGAIIFDTGWVGTNSAYIQCNPYEAWSYGYATPMTPTGIAGVYETGVPGIGIKIAWSNVIADRPGDINQAMIQNWPRAQLTMPYLNGVYLPPALYRAQFIKTGETSPGVISFQNPTASAVYGGVVAASTFFTSTQINVKTASCRVTNSNIVVKLPTTSAQSLAAVGSTQGATPFTISLVCDANINLHYDIDGPADPANAPGVLANGIGSGMATGVGVQVLQGAAPISLGTVMDAGIRTNSDNQAISIPMTARYYKTSPVVSSGLVNAVATFSMSYQ
ncbi:fimbrial protein [Cupriavidus sp. P-10]|uniref:fimbrial protein n=1 Tax=Cupriavidus sp. P-10 TaxID=2027911 RepID=UPI000E2EAF3C|nr:fimbrial protein [Cupriavidus sp. P-10]BDB23406.1 fimbrial protein [Cupriavidus sp. P-10]